MKKIVNENVFIKKFIKNIITEDYNSDLSGNLYLFITGHRHCMSIELL